MAPSHDEELPPFPGLRDPGCPRVRPVESVLGELGLPQVETEVAASYHGLCHLDRALCLCVADYDGAVLSEPGELGARVWRLGVRQYRRWLLLQPLQLGTVHRRRMYRHFAHQHDKEYLRCASRRSDERRRLVVRGVVQRRGRELGLFSVHERRRERLDRRGVGVAHGGEVHADGAVAAEALAGAAGVWLQVGAGRRRPRRMGPTARVHGDAGSVPAAVRRRDWELNGLAIRSLECRPGHHVPLGR
mmetsp:Transcript_51689/g.150165  ORF Transcript_51689/g.150165 Transcript_51689/m.150165 type:complete len:246 (-) Transcript_51689:660-1397(-)